MVDKTDKVIINLYNFRLYNMSFVAIICIIITCNSRKMREMRKLKCNELIDV